MDVRVIVLIIMLDKLYDVCFIFDINVRTPIHPHIMFIMYNHCELTGKDFFFSFFFLQV